MRAEFLARFQFLGLANRSAEVGTSPVSAHELINPFGLAYFPSRGKLPHIWLDVEHGRTIDCIEPLNFQRQIFNRQQVANRNTNTVGPILSPLREDADPGKVRPIARMTRFCHDFGFRHTMKEKTTSTCEKSARPKRQSGVNREESRSIWHLTPPQILSMASKTGLWTIPIGR